MKLRTQKSVPTGRLALFSLAMLSLLFSTGSAFAQSSDSPKPESFIQTVTYADLADLTWPAALVVKAQIRKAAEVEAERAPGLRTGWARLYIEAKTEAVLGGRTSLGDSLRYLVDVPLDAKGKPPKLGKRSVILFARPVAARPGELQLVTPEAQLIWDAALDSRLHAMLGEFYDPAAPPAVTGLREAIHVPGALAGEGESQFFLATASDNPAAIIVSRAPGAEPRWSVSFSELVESGSPPPVRDTLAWYRLACFLPSQLPAGADLSLAPEDRMAAARDYQFVLEQLGSCPRLRR
jgi:hypothetical protein